MSRRTDAFTRARTQATALLEDHPKLADAVKDLDYCATDDRFRRAVGRLWDARAALPGAAAYDGQPGGGSSESKVERLAMAGDPTDWDRQQFDHHLRVLLANLNPLNMPRVAASAHRLRVFVDVWGLTGRQANQRERAEVERVNHATNECALTREHLGCFVPVYRNSNLGGLLPEATPVGRWVYDESRKLARLPTSQEWRKHGSTDDDLRGQLIRSQRTGQAAKVSA